jgi:hypothetical protein
VDLAAIARSAFGLILRESPLHAHCAGRAVDQAAEGVKQPDRGQRRVCMRGCRRTNLPWNAARIASSCSEVILSGNALAWLLPCRNALAVFMVVCRAP